MTFPQCCPFFSVDMSRQGELVCFASRPVGRCQYDLCPFDLGPWGAWRAVVDEVLDHFLVLIDVSAHCGDRIVAGVHLDLAEPARFAAVGWSP